MAPRDLMPVREALDRLIAAGRAHPLPAENVGIAEAEGRVLATPVIAARDQPPFDVSAMDGIAFRAADSGAGRVLRVVGESAAGHPFAGTLGAGEAVTIFTGARLPEGADSVSLQEDVTFDGESVRLAAAAVPGRHVRRRGLDFRAGADGLATGQALSPERLALAASLGAATVSVARRPRVAILATGDELVAPGEPAGPARIVASNTLAVAALVRRPGGIAVPLGLAAARRDALDAAFARAAAEGADLLVTIGGASVGKHDLVREAIERNGGRIDFLRRALRPGKPLNFGALGSALYLGLPGNPVSAIVGARLFLRPLLAAMQGAADPLASLTFETGVLGTPLKANDHREDYLRARIERDVAGPPRLTPFPEQDSSLLSVLGAAGALVLHPAHSPARAAGEPCRFLPLSDGM